MPEIEVTSVEVTTEVVHTTSQNTQVGDAGPLTITVSDVGVPGPAGPTGVGVVRHVGPTQPDTTGWSVNDFWYDTSTEGGA